MADAPRPLRPRKRRTGPGSGKPPPELIITAENFDEHFPPPEFKRAVKVFYSTELADEICRWLEQGRTLKSWCDQDGKPDVTAVFDWWKAHPDFDIKYLAARERGMETLAETMLEDAAAERPPDKVPSARLTFDARRWYCGRMNQK
jgi:hypothetical protein